MNTSPAQSTLDLDKNKRKIKRHTEEKSESESAEENEAGFTPYFEENESCRLDNMDDLCAPDENNNRSYIVVETLSRSEYFKVLYLQLAETLQKPRVIYSALSFFLAGILYLFRVITLRSFQLSAYLGTEEREYKKVILWVQLFDGFMTLAGLFFIFILYKRRILHRTIYVCICVSHLIFLLLALIIIRLDQHYLFTINSCMLSTVDSLLVAMILTFCFRINRSNKIQAIYVASVCFMGYFFLLMYQMEDLFGLAADASPTNLASIKKLAVQITRNSEEAGYFSASNTMKSFNGVEIGVYIDKVKDYLARCNSLKISTVFLAVLFWHCYKMALQTKKKETFRTQKKEHMREMHMLQCAGVFIFLQILIAAAWSTVYNISLMHLVGSISTQHN
ncbi:hypothetical protein NEMIN01_0239 [Nematocida minor]|uniref:uncharacterized protein n=1 Tax=Nematocida minor TaxID=1912983 RepID=UPI0022206A48|nr:uncharacterized protein NEMIN01_0239 [Nematocida minor]KAI5188975.1 hypothetical protein NEMIN01_0239 [Nematocida minor]